VLHRAAIGRFSRHIPREFDLGWRKAGLEGDFLALFLRAHGLNLHMVVQGLSAALVNDTDSSADVRVAKRGDVLLEEINEAALALEQGEELKGRGRVRLRAFFREPRGLGRGRERWHGVAYGVKPASKGAVKKYAEQANPGEPEPGAERERGVVVGHAGRITRPVG